MAFLDADDTWVPEYLDVMKELIADFPEAIFYAGGHRWYNKYIWRRKWKGDIK